MLTTFSILLIAACALAGAAALGFRFRAARLPRWLPLAAGAVGGAVGAVVLMLPLGFCTFEPERDPLDQAFGVVLMLGGAAGVVALVGALLGVLSERRPLADAPQQGQFKGWVLPLVLLAPTLTVLALFLYYPALDTFRLSTLLARLGAPRTAFICVKNFTDLVREPLYGQIVLQSFALAFAIVVIGMSLALLIATMAYQPIRGASIYRTLLIWPYSISPIVAGLIFLLLFNPTGGLINEALNNLFGIRIGWLNDPAAAPWAVIIASVWKSLGFNVLFYIAGLQNVPKDLSEAAAIDGANALQRFVRVTLPMLSPITFFLIITNMTYAFFESFGTIDALTRGGPLNSTTTMMYQIYEVGVQNNDLGKGAAQSIVLFLMVVVLTIIQFRTTARSVNYGS
jgi:sn-glycerol 3-phosphate transport system permease protein